MTDNTPLTQFESNEAERLAMSMKFNRWSRVLIEVMIREQEQKLVASDQPVDAGDEDNFWEGVA